MRNEANPFTDRGQVRGSLYASADRLARRTSALHRARVTGRHAGEVIRDLAEAAPGADIGLIADLGCGRGTTTLMLAKWMPCTGRSAGNGCAATALPGPVPSGAHGAEPSGKPPPAASTAGRCARTA